MSPKGCGGRYCVRPHRGPRSCAASCCPVPSRLPAGPLGAGRRDQAIPPGAPGAGTAGREAARGTATSVDAEKVRQSAFLQASYGAEIKGVRVIRAPRAEASPVVEAPSKPQTPAKQEKTPQAPAASVAKVAPKT